MRIAVVVYDGTEPIELAVIGTLSMAKRVTPELSYFTVAQNGGTVKFQNGLRVEVDYSFDQAPSADLVIITGGPGWTEQVENPHMLSFIKGYHRAGATIASVCTGGLIVAATGLLDGRRATTKFQVGEGEESPVTTLARQHTGVNAIHALVVDEGDIVTGGGVTLGIDLTLYLLERYLGSQVSNEVARIMEYSAARAANHERLCSLTDTAFNSTNLDEKRDAV